MILTTDTKTHTMTLRGPEASSVFMALRDLHGAKSVLVTDASSGKAALQFEACDALHILEDDETEGGRLTVTRV